MKVSLSNFLRWGGRKESGEEAAPNGPFWGRKDRRRAPRRVLSGSGQLCWLDAEGDSRMEVAAFTDISEDGGGIGAVLRTEAPLGGGCWAIGSEGAAHPIVIRRCVPCDEGYRIGALLNPEPQVAAGWGNSKLKWVGEEETLSVSPASIRNAEEGVIEVNSVRQPPSDRVLLLEGGEFACLCILRKSTAYGDRHLLEVEPIADAAPTTDAQAA